MNTQVAEKSRNDWDNIAAGYDEFVTPTHMWLANEGLRRVRLGSGLRFLDVAAGSGALSIPAARRGAKVTSVDISGTMIAQLSARAEKEGVSLDCRVMDGHDLDLPDNSFDISGSQFGVMLFPDLPRGLRELVRVTKPGGRVLLHVYGPPQQIDFLGFFIGAIKSVVPDFTGLPDDPVPLPFQVADPDKLRSEMEGAGLKDVLIETITESLEFRTGAQMWDWVLNSNPIPGMLVADLSTEQRSAVRQGLEDRIRDRADANGVATLTNPIHIAIGTK